MQGGATQAMRDIVEDRQRGFFKFNLCNLLYLRMRPPSLCGVN
jgi:hypothetical protein